MKYSLRAMFDLKRGKGMLSVHGAAGNDAIRDVIELSELIERFLNAACDGILSTERQWPNPRGKYCCQYGVHPKLKDLALHLKAMLVDIKNEEEISELTAAATKVANFCRGGRRDFNQSMPDAVYWMDVTGRHPSGYLCMPHR